MKKFFSLLALVGVFAACQKEDLKTAFNVDPGVATIHVSAVCIDGQDITSATVFTYNGEAGSAEYTLKSKEYEALNTTVKVVATWKGYDGASGPFTQEQEVKLQVLPGGKTDVNLRFVLGEYDIDGVTYTPSFFENFEESEFIWKFLDKGHADGTVVAHDGEKATGKFVYNHSEFILRGTVNYTEVWGSDFADPDEPIEWIEDIPEVKDFFNEKIKFWMEPVEKTEKSFDITVSAFSSYCAFHRIELVPTYCTLTRRDNLGNEDVVATSKFYTNYSNTVGCYEEALPGHEAHYVAGHGIDDPAHSHGHGSSNAGGGIAYAD